MLTGGAAIRHTRHAPRRPASRPPAAVARSRLYAVMPPKGGAGAGLRYGVSGAVATPEETQRRYVASSTGVSSSSRWRYCEQETGGEGNVAAARSGVMLARRKAQQYAISVAVYARNVTEVRVMIETFSGARRTPRSRATQRPRRRRHVIRRASYAVSADDELCSRVTS